MVNNILGMFAGGHTIKRILQAYPELVYEDVSAALECASSVVDTHEVPVTT